MKNWDQISIYDVLHQPFKIDKPVRLIELFAGYGSQALALKYLGIPFEHHRICEWAVKSIQAYKDIHFTGMHMDVDMTRDEMIDFLANKGVSADYNSPMTREQIARLKDDELKTIVENIKITHNMVNVQQVHGEDLGIKYTDRYIYIMTYSFPCQDLSLAGKGKGMADTSTRSGMLWEVERILNECNELGELPKVLLMENVTQVHGAKNMEHFVKWIKALEKLGYINYWQDLIATDYGIPQTRNRTFMVSILGNYSYKFPKPVPLELRLKDMLEKNVDEKYFLSNKQIEQITNRNSFQNPLESVMGSESICSTITTGIAESQDGGINASMRVYCEGFTNNTNIRVKNATKKGYLEANEGDGVDISGRMEYHRGTVQKGKAQTLSTAGGENGGVVVNVPEQVHWSMKSRH